MDTNLIKTQPTPENSIVPTADGTTVVYDALLPLSFLVFFVAAGLVFSRLPKVLRERWFNSNRCTSQIPCRNCRYFTSNPYLKCAVHPDTAATDAAIDCADYQPKPEPEPSQRHLKD